MARKYLEAQKEARDNLNPSVGSTPASPPIAGPSRDSASDSASNSDSTPALPPIAGPSRAAASAPASASNSDSDSTPLDLRLMLGRNCSSWCSCDTTGSKTNVTFSDTNPLCTQIYLQTLQETRKSASTALGPTQNEMGAQERRRTRKNTRAQLVRDEEKYHRDWMLVQAQQMETRNLAFNATVEKLEGEKAALTEDILQHIENMQMQQPP